MAVNPEQPIITRRLPNNKRVALYIPNEDITCQYYRDVKIGDVVPDGHIITQYDIDNGDYRKVGINCASTAVDWMRDTIKNNYYTFNPLDVYDFIIDEESGNHLFDFPGEEDGLDCVESCFTQGASACYECAGGTGNGEVGPGGDPDDTTDDTLTIVQKCCNAGTAGPSTYNLYGNEDWYDSEFGTYNACNQIDCGYDAFGSGGPSNSSEEFVHYEPMCVYPLGNFGYEPGNNTYVNGELISGKGHNIVWNHFNKLQSDANAPTGDYLKYYPYWNHGSGAPNKMYYKDGNTMLSEGGVTGDEYWYPTDFNDRLDKRQRGINKNGTELYNLPLWISTTCEDRAEAGIAASSLIGTVNSPQTSPSMLGTLISEDGITACPEISDYYSGVISNWYQNPLIIAYIGQFFDGLNTEQIQDFSGNTVTDSPSLETGFGMSYLDSTDISWFKQGIIPEASPLSINDSTLIKDIMFRLGAPLPPLVMGYESAGNLPGHLGECDSILPLYITLIEEFKNFIQIGTFFSDFGIPNVDIKPTMSGLLDVHSARDLREEKINACNYIEFMTLPGGEAEGDGIYYGGNEIPSIYFNAPYNGNVGDIDDGSMTKEQYVRTFDCNTEFDNDIQFSKMRAVCKDGSPVLMGQSGGNGNESTTINHNTTDEFFNTGLRACNSKIKPYSNQELYYLSDGDLRESLGINFLDTKNIEQSTNNFLGSIVDDDFEQIPFPNLLDNGDGRLVNTNLEWFSDEFPGGDAVPADGSVFDGTPYIAENWRPIYQKYDNGDSIDANLLSLHNVEISASTPNQYNNFQHAGMMPYWSANNSECFSRRKCLIIDTMNPSELPSSHTDLKQTLVNNEWDIRQVMQTWIPIQNVPRDSRRENSKFKVSFMMKTVDIKSGVYLENTGIHLNAIFGYSGFDWTSVSRNYEIDSAGYYSNDENKLWPIVPDSNSQCSPNSHTDNHLEIYGNFSDEFCKKSKASFTNTELNKWEKMEFTFTPRYGDSNDSFPNWDRILMNGMKLTFMPLELSKGDERTIARDTTYDTNNADADPGAPFENPGVTTDEFNETANQYGDDVDISRNGAKIYLDNFEFKEDFSFHPDVDVRKNKGLNEYGNVSLTQYNNSEDSKAPLEAQFYFYPRYNFDDVFAKGRKVILEQFKFGQFYISDIDWGDGSSIEYTNEPFQLGVDKMLYHTYEINGVYEIKGTMFQIKSDSYTYSLAQPELIKYEGISGIAHNKKFNIKIYISMGKDEDFKYFGSEGFSFIPYKNTLPIIGGLSMESTYFKNLKRNIGLITDDNKIDINFKSLNDKLNSEHALSKVNSLFDDKLDILNIYRKPIVNENDITTSYLLTLPFPQYYEEFNVDTSNQSLTSADSDIWDQVGRPDIALKIGDFISSGVYPLVSTIEEKAYSFPVELFFNPTFVQNDVWNGGEYNNFQSELGKSIGDVDLTSIKYHNEPKSIWEMFGFEEDDLEQIGTPNNPRYWKNIIPEDYSIFRREGVNSVISDMSREYLATLPFPRYREEFDINNDNTINTLDTNQSITFLNRPDIAELVAVIALWEAQGDSGVEPSTNYDYPSYVYNWSSIDDIPVGNGLQQPIENFLNSNTIFKIDTYSEQDWIGQNEYGNTYYYPVLPKYGAAGKFIDGNFSNNKIPFSLEGFIENNDEDKSLIIKIENDKYNNNIFNDLSGNDNRGFIINDYKPKFNNKTFKPEKTKFIDTIKTSKTNGAF
tara:strand:- start:2849 stop:7996 length:5148 start_codon:yes stop_codon:yes gene_type:complete